MLSNLFFRSDALTGLASPVSPWLPTERQLACRTIRDCAERCIYPGIGSVGHSDRLFM
jgi:hypothetical protein